MLYMSAVLGIVGHSIQPLLSLLWCDINKLSVAVCVPLHCVVDWGTGVVLEYVDQLWVVGGPGLGSGWTRSG